LVQVTGGRAFFPDSVNELEDIWTTISVELKNEVCAWLSLDKGSERREGKWRKFRLKINVPK
jgi:hypothetical protein